MFSHQLVHALKVVLIHLDCVVIVFTMHVSCTVFWLTPKEVVIQMERLWNNKLVNTNLKQTSNEE